MNLKVKTSTWVRTIVFAIAIINQILVALGVSPFPLNEFMINEIIVQLDLLVATVISTGTGIWVWWKNNSFSKSAIEADAELEKKRLEK